MRTSKQLLFIVCFLISTTFAFSQTVDWQVHQGQGAGIFVPGPDDPPIQEILNELTGGKQPVHGDPGGFQYADIPSANDIGWEPAPIDEDGDLCWRLDRSRLDGFMTALDFTYFQTSVFVEDASQPFILRFFEVDDGARAYVFNSRTLQDPENAFIEGGDARLYAPIAITDISPLFVEGEENRIVIVQFDDSQTANYLKVEVLGGDGIGEGDECDDDTEGPQILVQADNGDLLTVDDFFQDSYQCGQPTANFVYLDNCTPTDSLEIIISSNVGFDSATGASIISGFVSATDATGNETREVFEYRILDTEAPTIVSTIRTIEDTLNVCGEYALSIDDLGVEVIDNCGGEVTLSLSDTLVTGDISTVTITATDATGNFSTTQVELDLADNPATLIVTAEDDIFEGAIGRPITFSAGDLISNDMASDASGLEVQEVTLIDETQGTLIDNGDDTYTFTPTDGFVDDVALTYIVKS
ncbi:MAG: cadherin-like domain-containing protein, partial [Bacteroidota bacterium]